MRFLKLLYLCNNNQGLTMRDKNFMPEAALFSEKRLEQLVSIAAYCLMPNHFHILLKEKTVGGITKFMRKLNVAYTMYFNTKYERIGNLLVRPFRSRLVESDEYFKHVIQYIHLNPVELSEPMWKQGKFSDLKRIERVLLQYPFGSIADFFGSGRPQSAIIDPDVLELFDELPTLSDVLNEASGYYKTLKNVF